MFGATGAEWSSTQPYPKMAWHGYAKYCWGKVEVGTTCARDVHMSGMLQNRNLKWPGVKVWRLHVSFVQVVDKSMRRERDLFVGLCAVRCVTELV